MTTLSTKAPGELDRVIHPPAASRWRVARVFAALLLALWVAADLRAAHAGWAGLVPFAASSALFVVGLWRLWVPRPAEQERNGTAFLALLAVFLPEHLFGAGRPLLHRLAPTLVVLLLVLLAPAIGRLASSSMVRGANRGTAGPLASWLFCLAGAVYFAFGTALAVVKLHAFGYVGQDVAYFMQCLYTAAHGHLFWANQYHDLLYSKPVWTDFAGHNQPVLFLLLPFYAVAPHAETLFLLRNLLLTLSAWPAYRLLRLTFAPLPAALLTAGFFLSPAILFQNFYDFAPLSLAALPLLCALLFYAQRRLLAFCLALIACLLVREDLVIAALGLAIVAAIQRRPRPWIMAPALLGLGWGAVSWLVVLPHFLHGAVSAVQSCFAYLGGTPLAILRSAMLHPSLFLTHNTAIYVKEIASPFLLVSPLFSPVSLVSLPYLAINVLGDRGCDAAIVFRHYALIPTILLLPGIAGLWHWYRRQLRLPRCSPLTYSLLFCAAAVLTTVLSIGPQEVAWFHRPAWSEEATAIAKQLPPQAAVAVPRFMLPLVANRTLVYQTARLLEYHHPDAEYVVVDRDAGRMGVNDHTARSWMALRAQLAAGHRYRLLSQSANFLVYQRIGDAPPSLAQSEAAAHE